MHENGVRVEWYAPLAGRLATYTELSCYSRSIAVCRQIMRRRIAIVGI